MRSITSLFRRLAEEPQDIAANPSLVLHVNREELTGTLEINRLEPEEPFSPLRISWIKKEGAKMKTLGE